MAANSSAVKQLKDLEIVYDCAAAAVLKVYSDLPGGTMALAFTETLPVTTGRGTYTVPFDAGSTGVVNAAAYIEGTIFRFEITANGVVRLYSGTLRFRKVGVYVQGANHESWHTQELSLN